MANEANSSQEKPKSTPLSGEEMRLISIIQSIVCKGNDAEVRRKRDGTLAVYEVKKKVIECR